MTALPGKKNNYVDNQKLIDCIKEFQRQKQVADTEGGPLPVIPDYAARCILDLCEGISRRGNFGSYCVDEATEALTKRGWLRYDQIRKNDFVLVIDGEKLIWSPILDIYVSNYSGLMHKFTVQGIDALVTPGHKFLTQEDGLQKAELLKTNQHLVLTGEFEAGPKEEIYADSFVELVGWSVTEGHYARRDGVNVIAYSINVTQNAGPKADRIRDALNKWYLAHPEDERKGRWRKANDYGEYNREGKLLNFRIRGHLAQKIQDVSPNRVLNMGFILALTQRQRELLIKTMVDGDGNTFKRVHKNGGVSFGYSQKDKRHMDAFASLLTLAGYTYRYDYREQHTVYGFSQIYYLHIASRPKRFCKVENVDFHGGRSGAGGKNGKHNNENTPTQLYSGIVWCPKTLYGNFMCRRGKYAYITGNTYRDEMVGDAIVDCVKAFGNFDTVKFNNPFGYFTLIGWRAMLRRIEEEHTETYLKFKSFRQAYSLGDHYFSDEDFVDTNSSSGENKVNVIDVADQVIMNFEEKMRRKKEKIKNKAAMKSGSKRKKTGIDRIFERGVKKK